MTVLAETSEHVTTLTLHRPEALNALTPGMLAELATHLAAAGADPEVRAVVLTGVGRAFSAGVDLKSLRAESADDGDVGELVNSRAREVIRLLAAEGRRRQGERVLLHRRARARAGLRPGGGRRGGEAGRHARQVGAAPDLGHEAYEAATSYPITDSAQRLASFG